MSKTMEKLEKFNGIQLTKENLEIVVNYFHLLNKEETKESIRKRISERYNILQ